MYKVTVDDIKWGKYDDGTNKREGPMYAGHKEAKFVPVENPNFSEKVLEVITATEGGNYSCINMWDRMIVSVGFIQWGEASQYSVSTMLGFVIDNSEPSVVLEPLAPALTLCGASFKKNSNGKWRFFLNEQEVNSVDLQRKLFLGCSGLQGSWDDTSKLRAKTWAAAMANVWSDVRARKAQLKFTADRLKWFDTPFSTEIFAKSPETDWALALRAAYYSFAANLPAVAARRLFLATEGSKLEPWSQDWCISIIKEMTFGPQIKIYPGRYDKIRPVIEKLFNVTLPKTNLELKTWEPTVAPEVKKEPEPVTQEVVTSNPNISTTFNVKSSNEASFSLFGYVLEFIRRIFRL